MEYTQDEIREQFLEHIRMLVKYWGNLENRTTEGKLDGLAFSILSMIDGSTMLPQFIVAPNSHPDDKQYYIENGEPYYPDNSDLDILGNISGSLHDSYYKTKK